MAIERKIGLYKHPLSVALYSSLHRECLPLLLFLSLVSRGFVSRAVFFFHIHCPRLPSFLHNLEKIIFFRSRCPCFLFIRGGRWPLTCFFFSPSSSSSFAERGFCLFVERKRGSLSDGLAFYSIVLMKVSLSIRHLFVASLCFSSQRNEQKIHRLLLSTLSLSSRSLLLR